MHITITNYYVLPLLLTTYNTSSSNTASTVLFPTNTSVIISLSTNLAKDFWASKPMPVFSISSSDPYVATVKPKVLEEHTSLATMICASELADLETYMAVNQKEIDELEQRRSALLMVQEAAEKRKAEMIHGAFESVEKNKKRNTSVTEATDSSTSVDGHGAVANTAANA